ncbi:MAG: hypothetical protein BWX64_02280 [Acidobacteria bacterium ADurb.Bin051]|nr:MAG: hypothetical protein BWX64_02280 [Acidobacteria bacterium ADurb.Bin051]
MIPARWVPCPKSSAALPGPVRVVPPPGQQPAPSAVVQKQASPSRAPARSGWAASIPESRRATTLPAPVQPAIWSAAPPASGTVSASRAPPPASGSTRRTSGSASSAARPRAERESAIPGTVVKSRSPLRSEAGTRASSAAPRRAGSASPAGDAKRTITGIVSPRASAIARPGASRPACSAATSRACSPALGGSLAVAAVVKPAVRIRNRKGMTRRGMVGLLGCRFRRSGERGLSWSLMRSFATGRGCAPGGRNDPRQVATRSRPRSLAR